MAVEILSPIVEMSWTVIVAICLVLCFLVLDQKRPKNFPPGPRGLPFVGVAPFVGRRPEKTYMKWRKTYGDVMGFRLGPKHVVVLNSYEVIHDALVKNSSVFSSRPDNFVFSNLLKKSGIAFRDYNSGHTEEKQFVKASLSKHGLQEEPITDEVMRVIENLGPDGFELNLEVKDKFQKVIGDVVARVVFGKGQKNEEDMGLKGIMHAVKLFFVDGSLAYLVDLIVPWLRHIPPIRTSNNSIRTASQLAHEIVSTKIDEHSENLDENDVRDLIDDYLLEMKKQDKKKEFPFTKDTLNYSIRDIFGGAIDTTTCSLIFGCLVLANRPEVMKKIREEVVGVFGREGRPQYALKDNLPYLQAFIAELLRFRTISPFGIVRCTSENVIFKGFNIPKGTTVFPNYYAVHNDPAHWEHPEKFIPERHLGPDGKVFHSKHLLSFGLGPRQCLAQRVAEMIIFIFLVAIFQRYEVIPTENRKNCERPMVFDDSYHIGMVLAPPKNTVTFVTVKD